MDKISSHTCPVVAQERERVAYAYRIEDHELIVGLEIDDQGEEEKKVGSKFQIIPATD